MKPRNIFWLVLLLVGFGVFVLSRLSSRGQTHTFSTAYIATGTQQAAAAPPAENTNTNGISAYWSFDSANWTNDDSGKGHTWTMYGTVSNTSGKVGNCADSGAWNASYFTAADNTDLSACDSNSLTVSAWVKPSSYDVYNFVLCKSDNTSGTMEWELSLPGTSGTNMWSRLSTYTNAATAVAGESKRIGITNNWYFIVGRIDATNRYGSARIGDAAGNFYPWTNSAVFGGFGPDGGGTNTTVTLRLGRSSSVRYFYGVIDEVAVWRRVVSDAELTNIYNGGAGKTWPLTP